MSLFVIIIHDTGQINLKAFDARLLPNKTEKKREGVWKCFWLQEKQSLLNCEMDFKFNIITA